MHAISHSYGIYLFLRIVADAFFPHTRKQLSPIITLKYTFWRMRFSTNRRVIGNETIEMETLWDWIKLLLPFLCLLNTIEIGILGVLSSEYIHYAISSF